MKISHQTPGRALPRRLLTLALAAAALVVAWQIAVAQQQHQPPAEALGQMEAEARAERNDAEAGEAALRVGTYDPNVAIQSYHRTARFREEMQQIQTEANNDPQRASQAQLQAQQKQQVLIESFYEDVEQVMPQIAEEADVKLVVNEIVYRDPSVRVEDLTPIVVEKINEDQGDDEARPADPFARPAQPQQQQPSQQPGQPPQR